MAASKSYFQRSAYRFLSTETNGSIDSDSTSFDLDESDVWNSSDPSPPSLETPRNAIAGHRKSKKKPFAFKRSEEAAAAAASVPINVPEWSKILKNEHREKRRSEMSDIEDEAGGEDDLIPPHEFLAKQREGTRVAYSVYEGIGRTLKGRDLSRVRDAIWEKTGFQR